MYGLTISDRATPAVDQLSDLVQGPRIANRYTGAVARLIVANFRMLDTERANSMGGKRTHFYANAAKGTNWRNDDSTGTITIHAAGIAQRLFGGTIKPVKGKFLAIPARAEAYGKSPREFDDLEPHFGEHGGALVQRQSQRLSFVKENRRYERGGRGFTRAKAGATEGGGVFFWLVKSVTQLPDFTVLPTPEDMHTAGKLAVADLIRSVMDTKIPKLPPKEL
jgi:hypothetical protein